MLRPPADWQAKWLEIQKTRLAIANLLGTLERWIKWRIRTSTSQQLFQAEVELMIKAREAQQGKASLAATYKAWTLHPLQQLLSDERSRREYQMESSSADYLGPAISGLSIDEMKLYLIWKGDKHGSVQDWRKDLKRSLSVIPSNPVGDGKETQTNNIRLLSGGIEGQPLGPHKESSVQSRETQAKKDRAYGPHKKG